MAWSSKWYSPVQALSCIPNKCSSVDLPAPEGPMMETNSPSLISMLMRRRTKVLVGPCSKYFSAFRRTIIGELIYSYIRLSLLTQGNGGIDCHRTLRRQVRGEHRNQHKHN